MAHAHFYDSLLVFYGVKNNNNNNNNNNYNNIRSHCFLAQAIFVGLKV